MKTKTKNYSLANRLGQQQQQKRKKVIKIEDSR